MLKNMFMAHIRADEFGTLAVHLYSAGKTTHMLSVTRQPSLTAAKELLLEKITHAPLLRAWVRRHFAAPDAPATPKPLEPKGGQGRAEAPRAQGVAALVRSETHKQYYPPAAPEAGRTSHPTTPPVALVRGSDKDYLVREGVWYPVEDLVAAMRRR